MNTYPAGELEGQVRGCIGADGEEAMCTCAMRKIQKKYTYSEYMALPKIGPVIVSMYTECVKGPVAEDEMTPFFAHKELSYVDQLNALVQKGARMGPACSALASASDQIYQSEYPENVKVMQMEKIIEKMEGVGCVQL